MIMVMQVLQMNAAMTFLLINRVFPRVIGRDRWSQ
jgi:hypothetical protein